MSYCNKKEKLASHCLVISIGISKYEKTTNIPDIPDVSDDIKTYKSTFSQNANYTFISNDYNKIYSKQLLLNHFQLLFDENLYDSITDTIKYNSLIITISGHCTNNSLIVSTGEKIQFIEILSMFTEQFKNKNLIINLPKFIIVDGQRGFDYITNPISNINYDEKQNNDIAFIEAQMMNDDEYITDIYSAIMCSVSTVLHSNTFSGQLAWNFTQILSENIKNNKDIIFYDIIKQLRHRINAALDDYQFSIDFIEHDMDIDDVIFQARTQMRLSATNSSNGISLSQNINFQKQKEKKHKHFNRSNSLGNILNLKKNKSKKPKKDKDKSPLSPRRFFKRTQSLSASFNGKRSKSQPPKRKSPRKSANKSNTKPAFAFPEDEEINDIIHDNTFRNTIEWNESIEILSKTKDKTRIRVQWLFPHDNDSHTIALLHSQKLHNPYIKSKRVLFINGKQIWSQKSTNTQFIEMFNGNVIQININFDENKKNFTYVLKINNKTHKQLFNKWNQEIINNKYVE